MKSLFFQTKSHNILKAKYNALNQYGKCVTRRDTGLKEVNKEPDKWYMVTNAIRDCYPVKAGDWLFERIDNQIENIIARPPYRVGETVYWTEPFIITDIDTRTLDDDKFHVKIKFVIDEEESWGHYATKTLKFTIPDKKHSPYSMSEKLARTFVKITDVRPERLSLPLSEKELALEGGEVTLPLLKEYRGLWVWRIEMEKGK